ncbi:hypothetical protein PYW08_005612 [Mythimna loreyi]|uniref:Uncharacterized protein n=1 Tax=Mythimna loreyi TaxID=667449 RepID=A0ACC2QH28_9NEOP|nr:hypothetical protein PYW08_005612 [Mythimna loreyi]
MAAFIGRKKVLYQLRQVPRQLHNYNSSRKTIVPSFDMTTERKAFLDVLPEVINTVVTGPKLAELPQIRSWVKELLEYMLGRGKLGRGLMVSIGYRMFEEPENYSEETQHHARVLGWCSEMLQSKFIILDDILDNAIVRRGQPCWHTRPDVGISGINDAVLLYQSALEVMDLYFGKTDFYADLMRYFNEAVYRASMGEHFDLWASYNKEKGNLDVFSMDLVNTMAKNKTSYYSFKLPIFLPLLLVKNGKQKANEQLSKICSEFGKLMHYQDDYMDVCRIETVTGKTGRDIQEGKCTWVAVTALQHCNEAQRAIFKECYGSKDPEHVKRIKQLYNELHIPKLSLTMKSLLLRKTLCLNQLRTLHRSAVAFSVPATFNMHQNKRKFDQVLPEVMDTLMTSPKFTKQSPEFRNRIEKLLTYSLDSGKQGTGLAVPFTYQKLEDPKYFMEEKLHPARLVGWGLLIVQGSIIVVDDIIESSTARLDKPCWYQLPDVGTSAINDSFLINHCVMEVFELKFGKEPFFTDLVNVLNESLIHTAVGQYLDYSSSYSKAKNNLDSFTMERFNAIAAQKTSYYSIRLPVQAGLVFVKNRKERDTTELNNICLEFGKILQFQNDYEDVFWDTASSGKVCADIQDGKITWFAVTALERCNKAQRAIFKEYYGSKDPEHVKRIKQLYDELQIEEVYQKFKKSFYEDLERRIRALPRKGETELFLEIMEICRKQIY